MSPESAAWAARESAYLQGPTAVGAAVVSAQGEVYAGCNIEHRFRSHCIHAEVAALAAMTVAGDGPATHILIVAEREQFTPCGSCLDWIFELGGENTIVSFQNRPGDTATHWYARELMPMYPK